MSLASKGLTAVCYGNQLLIARTHGAGDVAGIGALVIIENVKDQMGNVAQPIATALIANDQTRKVNAIFIQPDAGLIVFGPESMILEKESAKSGCELRAAESVARQSKFRTPFLFLCPGSGKYPCPGNGRLEEGTRQRRHPPKVPRCQEKLIADCKIASASCNATHLADAQTAMAKLDTQLVAANAPGL